MPPRRRWRYTRVGRGAGQGSPYRRTPSRQTFRTSLKASGSTCRTWNCSYVSATPSCSVSMPLVRRPVLPRSQHHDRRGSSTPNGFCEVSVLPLILRRCKTPYDQTLLTSHSSAAPGDMPGPFSRLSPARRRNGAQRCHTFMNCTRTRVSNIGNRSKATWCPGWKLLAVVF